MAAVHHQPSFSAPASLRRAGGSLRDQHQLACPDHSVNTQSTKQSNTKPASPSSIARTPCCATSPLFSHQYSFARHFVLPHARSGTAGYMTRLTVPIPDRTALQAGPRVYAGRRDLSGWCPPNQARPASARGRVIANSPSEAACTCQPSQPLLHLLAVGGLVYGYVWEQPLTTRRSCP